MNDSVTKSDLVDVEESKETSEVKREIMFPFSTNEPSGGSKQELKTKDLVV